MSDIDPPECYGHYSKEPTCINSDLMGQRNCEACAFNVSCFHSTMGTPEAEGAIAEQVGGDHYKRMGHYQPWLVLQAWLTPEEFKGYMKGTAIAYLARERAKGGEEDIAKATHTLRGLLETL